MRIIVSATALDDVEAWTALLKHCLQVAGDVFWPFPGSKMTASIVHTLMYHRSYKHVNIVS